MATIYDQFGGNLARVRTRGSTRGWPQPGTSPLMVWNVCGPPESLDEAVSAGVWRPAAEPSLSSSSSASSGWPIRTCT